MISYETCFTESYSLHSLYGFWIVSWSYQKSVAALTNEQGGSEVLGYSFSKSLNNNFGANKAIFMAG